MHGAAMSPSSGERTLTRANIFGYFGQGGTRAATTFRVARSELPLDPIHAEPLETSADGALFMLCRTEARSVSHAAAPDGSFIALIGNVYDPVATDELLTMWLADGIHAFKDLHLEGFVTAWNAGTSELVLVRDKYGMEVGYYAKTDHGVLFSDDQETLLRMGVDREIDAAAIDTLLTVDYFPAPLTPYKAIGKLAPGSYVRLAGSEMEESYWTEHLPVEPVPYDTAVESVRPVFEGSLRRMWPDDGEVGLLLSGGIDSAMVAVGITRMLGQPLRAFTFRYEEYDGRLNESGRARIVSDQLGIAHEEISVRPQEMLADLDGSVAMYGEPFNWGLHTYKLGPIADRGIRTVFSGAGADGTDLSKRLAAGHRFNSLPGPVRSAVRLAVRGVRPLGLSRQMKAEWVTRPVESLAHLYSKDSELGRRHRAALYRDPKLAESGNRLLRSIFEDAAASLPPDDQRSLMVMDKLFTAAEAGSAWNRAFARGNGLEARLPFNSAEYNALGLGVIGSDGKALMRQLALQYLPEQAANAPKQPQEMPVGSWIRGPLADPVRQRLSELPPAMAEIFDPAGVRAAVDRHIAGSEERGWQIITLLTLESWFRQQQV